MTSVVLIVPIVHRDAVNHLGEELGWGRDIVSSPVSANGVTVTHYGCRSHATDSIRSLFVYGQTGEYPVSPLPAEELKKIFETMIVDFSDTLIEQAHFDAVLKANNFTAM